MKDLRRFSIGVTPERYEWLSKQAESNHRSMSGQVNKAIEEAMKKEEDSKKAA